MFSRKTLLVVGLLVLIMINALLLTINSRNPHNSYGLGRLALSVVAPLQDMVTGSVRTLRDVWFHYFYLVTVASENEKLQGDLGRALRADAGRQGVPSFGLCPRKTTTHESSGAGSRFGCDRISTSTKPASRIISAVSDRVSGLGRSGS